MADDELTALWQELGLLHGAVAELLELERTALGILRPQMPAEAVARQPSAPEAIAGRLEALRDRLQTGQAEAERHAAAEQARRLTEIEVERVNVIEPDGTVRLTLSNRTRFPAPIVEGKQGRRAGGALAGVIFYNDDGDECGGLYGYGRTEADGSWSAGGGLNLDQYRPQEQVVGINYYGRDGKNTAGVRVWERMPGAQVQFPDQECIDASLIGRPYATRFFAGRTSEGAAVVRLSDAQGRLRLRLAVALDGSPSIELLDEAGRVTHRLPEDESKDRES